MTSLTMYGYKSSVANSNNFQNMEDLATSFHSSPRILADSPTARPVIVVAHSLGGLIVKQVCYQRCFLPVVLTHTTGPNITVQLEA